jgi:hypothetical protein
MAHWRLSRQKRERKNGKLFDVGQFSIGNAVLFGAENGVFPLRYSIQTGWSMHFTSG